MKCLQVIIVYNLIDFALAELHTFSRSWAKITQLNCNLQELRCCLFGPFCLLLTAQCFCAEISCQSNRVGAVFSHVFSIALLCIISRVIMCFTATTTKRIETSFFFVVAVLEHIFTVLCNYWWFPHQWGALTATHHWSRCVGLVLV